jgi:hypothetical protein
MRFSLRVSEPRGNADRVSGPVRVSGWWFSILFFYRKD